MDEEFSSAETVWELMMSNNSPSAIELSTTVTAREVLELCKYRPDLLLTSDEPQPSEQWKLDLIEFCVASAGLDDAARQTLCTAKIVTAYTKLCSITLPVTGASIIHSKNPNIRWLYFWNLFFLVICLSSLVIANLHIYSTTAAECHCWINLSDYSIHYYPVLSGLLWGGLGSCVYLLKKVNDISQSREFDPDVFTGIFSRIMLGATLGWVVVNIFDMDTLDVDGVSVPAVAFLTGLSVKVVYGFLEKVVGELEQKFKLHSLKGNNAPKVSFKDQLAQFQLKLDPSADYALFQACSALRLQLEKQQQQQADHSAQNTTEK
ncbi:hypothetical protein A5320_02425 [Rheinheimera sp. SA_1]|jgi:hypothetical protein|uniref:hypothetical protein n=1 Tax=Rheinheimera sp. SA_1 TaxID=1827365 RepID=UPI0007FC2057|nr:hypothetical protein [Rheinheimera sp. SA_1]OBP16285.1 hypothetical protein A5320_02425 [Rheinheimera sp. SA_1]